VNPTGAGWAAVLVGATMVATPLAPGPTLTAAGFGAVPAAEPARAVAAAEPVRVTPWAALWTGGPRATPPSPSPPPPRPPVRLHLPVLAVDAAVVPVDTDADGGLAIPADPAVVGWWRRGAAPGAPTGSVVLVGHVDTSAAGPGALFRAATLRPGDRVVLGTASGDLPYAVAAVRHYPKVALPAEVFGVDGTPRLVLVTCGGTFDRRTRHYSDNVVVYAVPDG
jgi:hypothetical protein